MACAKLALSCIRLLLPWVWARDHGVQCWGETKGQMGQCRAPLQLVAEAALGSNATPAHPHLQCGCAGTREGENAILNCLLSCGFNAFFVLCSV